MDKFENVNIIKYWTQKVIPLVYDNSLSIYELVGKVVERLNLVIENNNNLPNYIAELIREYISSGEIENVVREILANYILNVKYPPDGITPASGDGTTDDTDAIQGCIDYAYNHGGIAVYFPSGSYLTQSLVLHNKVTLFGYDRYNTRLVLKGGATTALLSGDIDEITLTGLCFDGNMDIQVNNINLIDINVGTAFINNLLLNDGYELLKIVVNDNLQINNIIFDSAVTTAFNSSGNGYIQGSNLIFNNLSTLNGQSYANIANNNSVINNMRFNGAAPIGLIVSGSNNKIDFSETGNIVIAYNDNGDNNSFYNYGKTDSQRLNNSKWTITEKDYTENIGGNKKVTANSLSETIATNKIVNAANLTENITEDKTVNAENYNETITGDKTVNAENYNETITGDKTVNAENYNETITGDKTIKVNNNVTNEIDGTKNEKIGIKGIVNAPDYQLNIANHLTYETPTKYNGKFDSIKMKDINNNIYDIAVLNMATPYILTVGEDGDFDTITAAVNKAKTYADENNRVLIIINSGTYNESITLNPNPGIDFIGLGFVNWNSTGAYPEAALYTTGKCYVENIIFKATPQSYCVHIEAGNVDSYIKGNMLFRNCYFDGIFGSGLGDGIGLKFENCTFAYATLYVHNKAKPTTQEAMTLKVQDCMFLGTNNSVAVTIEDAASIAGVEVRSYMFCSFINCTIFEATKTALIFRDKDHQNDNYLEYIPGSPNIALDSSYGNNYSGLNNSILTFDVQGINAYVSENAAYAIIRIPYDLKDYDLTINSMTLNGVGNITNGATQIFGNGFIIPNEYGRTESYVTGNITLTPKWKAR